MTDAPVIATEADTRQELQITSSKPLRCSLPSCTYQSREITNGTPYAILTLRSGTILFHLRCVNINPNGNLNDAEYVKHVRDRLTVDRFLGR